VGASITEVVTLAAVLAGCQPNLGAPPSLVTSPRILAVSATPAEAAPGTMVTYTALVVDGSAKGTGEPPAVPIDWAFCNDEKPLSDLDDVSASCFTYGASFLVEIGQGPSATGALPFQACSLFGPDVPPAMPMMPAGRPADPDPTGGYYQPVRLILATNHLPILAAEESRILCGLPGATTDVLEQFRAQYHPNTNPTLTGLAVVEGSATTPLAPDPDDGTGAGFPVKAGSTLTLRASWPACAAGMPSCGGAEAYAYYDEQAQTVTTLCEQLTVSWFATGGSFAGDRSSADAGAGPGITYEDAGADAGAPLAACDAPTFADGTWTAPSTAGTVLLWAVLRDDRGGVTWTRYRITAD
jgi:hypothetical protein